MIHYIGHSVVGFVVDKVALGQVFSEYFGFPCQSSFHQLLHNHPHLSSGVCTIGQKWLQYKGLSPTPPIIIIKKTQTFTINETECDLTNIRALICTRRTAETLHMCTLTYSRISERMNTSNNADPAVEQFTFCTFLSL
jgi:hypothetical protein